MRNPTVIRIANLLNRSQTVVASGATDTPKAAVRTNIPALICACCVFCFVFLLHASWIHRFGTNVPFGDEWENLELFRKYGDGTLTIFDLFAQHNEHRIAVARIAFLGMFGLFGEWNLLSNMLFSAAVLASYLAIWSYTLYRIRVALPIIIVSIAILASPLQVENILWGFQIQFYTMVFGIVAGASIIALARHISWIHILFLVLCCSISTFSIASGLFSWFIIGLCLTLFYICKHENVFAIIRNRAIAVKLAVFAAYTIAATGFYLYGYESPATSTPYKVQSAQAFFSWFVRALCLPLLPEQTIWLFPLAIGMWFVIVAGLVQCFRRRHEAIFIQRFVLLVAVLTFLLLNAALMAYSRGNYGKIPTRYATVFLWNTGLFLLALDSLLRFISFKPWLKRIFIPTGLAVCFGLVVVHGYGYSAGYAQMAYFHGELAKLTQQVLAYLQDPSPQRQLGNAIATISPPALKTWLDTPATAAYLPSNMLGAGTLHSPAGGDGRVWPGLGTADQIAYARSLLDWFLAHAGMLCLSLGIATACIGMLGAAFFMYNRAHSQKLD